MDFFQTKDSYKSKAMFIQHSGLNLTTETFNSLKTIASNSKLKYSKNSPREQVSLDIWTYIMRPVKGSNRYRKIMMGKLLENIPHNIVKFSSNTETIIGWENSKKLNGIWNSGFFSNQMRTFLFKLHNNTLGYNNMVAHFVRGHSANCTFCDITQNPDEELENPLHIFYSCGSVSDFINEVFTWTLGEPTVVSRQEFFVGFNMQDHRKNEALRLVSFLVKKFIWDSKQRFSLPNLERCKIFIAEETKIMRFVSSKSRTVFELANLNFTLG